jgi:hypothetical protein
MPRAIKDFCCLALNGINDICVIHFVRFLGFRAVQFLGFSAQTLRLVLGDQR